MTTRSNVMYSSTLTTLASSLSRPRPSRHARDVWDWWYKNEGWDYGFHARGWEDGDGWRDLGSGIGAAGLGNGS
jgi:hypothetical protein